MVRWVVRSIPHGGFLELFLIQSGVVEAMVCAYKIIFAANQKE